jgi:response regulator RpfG family c-di-GMP phosphodiesterase
MPSALESLLPGSVWVIAHKLTLNDRMIEQSARYSFELWPAAETKRLPFLKKLFQIALRKKPKKSQPFCFEMPSKMQIEAFPITFGERELGILLVWGAKAQFTRDHVKLVTGYIESMVSNAIKSEELARMSATIRPRAIALSTVHTVHRIINSTLNLDELVSRLTHLTAQVLRVHRCAIYLLDENTLLCKALVGYPKNQPKGRRIKLGHELEGRVAKSADIQLRKKVLCIPLIDEDVIGVVTVTQKKDKKDFSSFDLEILTTLAEEAVIAIKNAQLYEDQRRVTLSTIRSLAVVLGSRVPQVGYLTPDSFANLALSVAQEMRLNDEQTQALHYAALLKETTKIGIPEEILKKTSKLTHEELSRLREHTVHGARIVQNFESLKTVAPIILYSREKFDGTGYPEGLKAEAIPVGARILAVLNAFEAIVGGRPYRGKATESEALDELRANSGTQFDPKVVDAFVKVIKKDATIKILKNAG